MAGNEQDQWRPESIKPDDARAGGGPLALDTTLRKTFAAVAALVGVLAGLSVFTAPCTRSPGRTRTSTTAPIRWESP